MMAVVEVLLALVTTAAMSLLIAHLLATQVREYYFYKANNWDFRIDSHLDRLQIDRRMFMSDPNLTNWQRFYLFRPICIINFSAFLGLMI
ncbi:hypothetical protein [Agrobacterium larrymoorei]|uniref:hypothetical protein n=1 Tax=Agrobacterium larrymoorei TaxID=160699 RepID=UPI001F454DC7|nr:hypothetical protein [Agrobacterium larrymoorei]